MDAEMLPQTLEPKFCARNYRISQWWSSIWRPDFCMENKYFFIKSKIKCDVFYTLAGMTSTRYLSNSAMLWWQDILIQPASSVFRTFTNLSTMECGPWPLWVTYMTESCSSESLVLNPCKNLRIFLVFGLHLKQYWWTEEGCILAFIHWNDILT